MLTTMKKYSIYLLAAAAGLLATACGGGSDSVDTASEVTFTTEITRVGVLTELADGAQMCLYVAKGSTVSRTDELHKAVRQSGVWKGSPSVTLQPEEERRLFAIYPFDQNAADPTAYPVTVAAQEDVLFSGAGALVTYQKPAASLKMRHAMAMLAFDIRSYVGGTLQSVTVADEAAFPTEGTLRVSSGRITETKRGAYTHACNVKLSQGGGTGDAAAFFVIPFTAKASTQLTLTVDGKAYACSLPAQLYDRGTKYVLHLNLTEAGLTLLEDQTETVSLDEPGSGLPTGEPYSLLRVTHNATDFTVPTVAGTGAYGYIHWGVEGAAERYEAGKKYVYPSAQPYVVAIDLWNATGVQFGSLTGVSEIDFSKF